MSLLSKPKIGVKRHLLELVVVALSIVGARAGMRARRGPRPRTSPAAPLTIHRNAGPVLRYTSLSIATV